MYQCSMHTQQYYDPIVSGSTMARIMHTSMMVPIDIDRRLRMRVDTASL